MTEEKPKTKKVNDLDALSTLTGSTNYAIPILDLNDRDEDGDPKLKQVPINLLQSLFKDETNLHKVATTGKYSDLKNLPQLFSGNYADLSGKPNIPSRTSDLQNDSGFLTQHQDISQKADKSEIPSKTSDLQNDSGFLTQHQDISGKVDISMFQGAILEKLYMQRGGVFDSFQPVNGIITIQDTNGQAAWILEHDFDYFVRNNFLNSQKGYLLVNVLRIYDCLAGKTVYWSYSVNEYHYFNESWSSENHFAWDVEPAEIGVIRKDGNEFKCQKSGLDDSHHYRIQPFKALFSIPGGFILNS